MNPVLTQWESRCRDHPELPVIIERSVGVAAADFHDRARKLQAQLHRYGVRPGHRVALGCSPSTDLLLAITAVWMSGASFVPVDPADQSSRTAAMLFDSKPALVIGDKEGWSDRFELPSATIAQGVLSTLRQPRSGILQQPTVVMRDEAYVIFTSGSTGRPKGVSVGSDALAAYLHEARTLYRLDTTPSLIPLTLPATFDAAILQLIPPLVTTCVAVVIDDPIPTRGLAEFLATTHDHVLVKATPGQVRILDQLLRNHQMGHLRGVFVLGGEALRYEDIEWLRDLDVVVFNEYGPTEATVGCVIHEVGVDDVHCGPVPIGHPHGSATLATVELAGEPSADNNPLHELVISGPCLAYGYINADNSAFDESGGRRSYRTGDLVRQDRTGAWHYLGRVDDQVKVNGFRVELGEIEAQLRSAAAATAAAVIVDRNALIGFLVSPAVGIEDAENALREQLPQFMQLTALHRIAEIPLTAHGKVDRSSLATIAKLSARATIVDIATIRQLWSEVLASSGIVDDESFFDRGDSMAALRLVGRIQNALGIVVPATLIFDHPTLREFVDALATHQTSNGTARSDTVRPELTPWQQQLLRASVANPLTGAYTVVSAVRVHGISSWSSFEAAAGTVIAGSRLFSPLNDPTAAVEAENENLPAHSAVERVAPAAANDSHSSFDAVLASARTQPVAPDAVGSLFRPRVLIMPTGSDSRGLHGMCAVVAHHAVLDEISAGLLWNDIFSLCTGQMPAPRADFFEWAARALLPTKSAAALVERLTSRPLDHDALPVSARIATTSVRRIHRQDMNLGPAVIREIATRCGVTTAAVCGAAASYALGAALSLRRFVLFMPMTMRRTPDDFAVIGPAVALMPVLAEMPTAHEDSVTYVRRWHRSVGFSADHTRVDPRELTEQLAAADPRAARSAVFSLALETPGHGHCGSVSWEEVSTPDIAKFDLSIHLDVGTGPATGQGRLISRIDVNAENTLAERVSDLYIDALTKLSRSELLPPITATERNSPDPRTDRQPAQVPALSPETIAQLIGDVLGRAVNVDDDLFMLGATSLTFAVLANTINHRLGSHLSPVDLFDHPTPASLAPICAQPNSFESEEAPK